MTLKLLSRMIAFWSAPSAVSLPTLSQPVPQTAQTKTARLHALSDVVSSCRSAEHIRVVLWQLAAAQPQQHPRRQHPLRQRQLPLSRAPVSQPGALRTDPVLQTLHRVPTLAAAPAPAPLQTATLGHVEPRHE